MRDQKNMLDAFMPLHEKEWESRLFIDSAIKNSTEYHLEAIARALAGQYDIVVHYAPSDKPFHHTQAIKHDKGYVDLTERFGLEATMREFVFYGNNKTEIWLKIIDFWAGKCTVYPCGGAAFPNKVKNETKKKNK